MNRTGIEWAHWTWNPVTGCLHGCPWCYARRMAKRLRGRFGYPHGDPFCPTFHEDRLNEPLDVKKPARIFAISMGDLFGSWVSKSWMKAVMDTIEKADWHKFIILTKDPMGLIRYERYYELPSNLWVGTSVEDSSTVQRIRDLSLLDHPNKFVSFEPLLGDILLDPRVVMDIYWFIIGAQTGPGAQEPHPIWVQHLAYVADLLEIPVFLKDNIGGTPHSQFYPEDLTLE